LAERGGTQLKARRAATASDARRVLGTTSTVAVKALIEAQNTKKTFKAVALMVVSLSVS
jgi:hypothetical protein